MTSVRVGMPAKIFVPGEGQPYPSRVEDIRPDRLVLAYPMRQLVPVRLKAGDQVTVEVTGERGVYRLETVVLGRDLGRVPVLVVAAGEWVRHQRRDHFRVALGMAPAAARLLRPGAEGQPVRLLLRDVSGGGLGFVSDRPLQVGDRLEVELNLNGGRPFPAQVEVVWVRPRAGPGGPAARFPFEAGARFVGIDPAKQEAVVKFCLRKQLRQRRPEEA